MIRVKTVRGEIRTLAKRWYTAYGRDMGKPYAIDKKEIYDRLKKLNLETATLKDIRTVDPRLIDNGWIVLCDECGSTERTIAQLSYDPDFNYGPDMGDEPPWVCHQCIMDAREKIILEELKG